MEAEIRVLQDGDGALAMEDISRLATAYMDAERARRRAHDRFDEMASQAVAAPSRAALFEDVRLARLRLGREVSRAQAATARIMTGPYAYAWSWLLADDCD